MEIEIAESRIYLFLYKKKNLYIPHFSFRARVKIDEDEILLSTVYVVKKP